MYSDNYVPKDWLTYALPHRQQYYRVGFWGSKHVLCCSCGISAIGRNAANILWDLHVQNEYKMYYWYKNLEKSWEGRP